MPKILHPLRARLSVLSCARAMSCVFHPRSCQNELFFTLSTLYACSRIENVRSSRSKTNSAPSANLELSLAVKLYTPCTTSEYVTRLGTLPTITHPYMRGILARSYITRLFGKRNQFYNSLLSLRFSLNYFRKMLTYTRALLPPLSACSSRAALRTIRGALLV